MEFGSLIYMIDGFRKSFQSRLDFILEIRKKHLIFPALIISCTFFSTPFLLPALGKDDSGNQNFLYETSENNVQKSVRIVGMSDLFRL